MYISTKEKIIMRKSNAKLRKSKTPIFTCSCVQPYLNTIHDINLKKKSWQSLLDKTSKAINYSLINCTILVWKYTYVEKKTKTINRCCFTFQNHNILL